MHEQQLATAEPSLPPHISSYWVPLWHNSATESHLKWQPHISSSFVQMVVRSEWEDTVYYASLANMTVFLLRTVLQCFIIIIIDIDININKFPKLSGFGHPMQGCLHYETNRYPLPSSRLTDTPSHQHVGAAFTFSSPAAPTLTPTCKDLHSLDGGVHFKRKWVRGE